MDIYCGNLAYATTDDGLKAAFAAYGEVTSARVVTDRMTGRSKGFGFVEMPNAEQAEAAIAALNGSEMDGRPIRVNESQPKPQDDRRGGGRGGFGGRGGRGGGSVCVAFILRAASDCNGSEHQNGQQQRHYSFHS